MITLYYDSEWKIRNIKIKDRERLLKIHEQDKKHVDELARERDILNKNFLKVRVLRIIWSGGSDASTEQVGRFCPLNPVKGFGGYFKTARFGTITWAK